MPCRPKIRVLTAAALLIAPAGLHAQNALDGLLNLTGATYTVRAENFVSASGDVDDARYSTPISTAYNGVGSVRIVKSTGTFICTGSLLADGRTVLTAAHCLNGTVTSVSVNFYPTSSTAVVTNASSWTQNPLYTGNTVDENDVAVLHLNSEAPSSITRYALATTSGVNNPFEFVGFGRRGSFGAGTPTNNTTFSLSGRRSGENLFDITMGDARWNTFWTDAFGAQSSNVLLADFDNGTTGYNSNDAMCWAAHLEDTTLGSTECDAGLGLFEALTSNGDSGGPGFVNGKIASVTSFGLTFGTPTFICRSFALDSGNPACYATGADIDNALNSSFGEFAGFVDVAYQSSWIAGQMNLQSLDQTSDGPLVSSPEPTSAALLAGGIMMIVGVARRRRRSASVAC